jgi:hypothetical protein
MIPNLDRATGASRLVLWYYVVKSEPSLSFMPVGVQGFDAQSERDGGTLPVSNLGDRGAGHRSIADSLHWSSASVASKRSLCFAVLVQAPVPHQKLFC